MFVLSLDSDLGITGIILLVEIKIILLVCMKPNNCPAKVIWREKVREKSITFKTIYAVEMYNHNG